MRKKKERRKDEEKIYEHLSDFGTALSGLWADRGDCRLRWNIIFYCMDWHCSDPLCAGRTASYGNVGQDTADRQVDIWNIVRYIFSVVSCDLGNGDYPDACEGRKKSGLCDRAGCTGARG